MMPRRFKRRVGVSLMRHPRLCRRFLQVVSVLPAGLQKGISPTLRLRSVPRYARLAVARTATTEHEEVLLDGRRVVRDGVASQ